MPCNSWLFLERHLFRFCNQNIAAGFDPPHPLKCTCKLFLKHDVTKVTLGVVVNGQHLSGAAKWADIVCEIDNQSVLYHLLHNVNDRYMNPYAQDAVKISLAVQVMTSIVAAAILV
jgi:hypothetical protein